jgi:putative membrane protein
MNRGILVVAFAAVALSSGCAKKQTSGSPTAESPEVAAAHPAASAQEPAEISPQGHADESFFESAADGGMAEVEAGKLAQTKGSSAAVRSFAAMMVKDHTAANDKLQKIAEEHDITLPTQLSPDHESMMSTLAGLSGTAFDQEYLRGQVKDHEATAALLQSESGSGQNADAKAFAKDTLPIVQTHLKKAKELAQTSQSAAGR